VKAVIEEKAPAGPARSNRLLPYLAVFQADVQQTLRSWVFRAWVLMSSLVAVGYLLYRLGAYREAGIVQPATGLVSDLLQWAAVGSITLVIILTAGSISAELGNLADSVLSRGISRHQYFLGKWHARLTAVLGTFFLLGLLVMAGCVFLLRDENLSFTGCLVALAIVTALLAVVVTCGVTVSAMSSSTVLGITMVWLLLYGGGFLLAQMPASWPSPDRALRALPNCLRGLYDPQAVTRLVIGCAVTSCVIALAGMVCFSRRDV
jgi:ABC-type transport system involved in multi-copper enzyme maturation permease subunit